MRSPFGAILAGGLLAGLIDITYACVFYGLMYDVPAMRIFQSVAAGWIGRDAARAGGVETAALGLASHFLITTAMAAAYVLVSRRLRILAERPLVFGPLYGLFLYGLMNFVVVPLSNAPAPAFTAVWPIVTGVLVHAFGVGLVIALFAARATNPSPAPVAA